MEFEKFEKLVHGVIATHDPGVITTPPVIFSNGIQPLPLSPFVLAEFHK